MNSPKISSRSLKLRLKQDEVLTNLTQEAKGIYENLSEFIKNSLSVSDIKETSDSKDESHFYSLNMDGECWKTACSGLPGLNSNDTSQVYHEFGLEKSIEAIQKESEAIRLGVSYVRSRKHSS